MGFRGAAAFASLSLFLDGSAHCRCHILQYGPRRFVMQTKPHIITVVVRDVGEGGAWRCTDEQPQEAALLLCDVRAGRFVDTAPSSPRR